MAGGAADHGQLGESDVERVVRTLLSLENESGQCLYATANHMVQIAVFIGDACPRGPIAEMVLLFGSGLAAKIEASEDLLDFVLPLPLHVLGTRISTYNDADRAEQRCRQCSRAQDLCLRLPD